MTHGLGLGSTGTGAVERGGMFSWRTAAEPYGRVRGWVAARAAAGLGMVPGSRARSKRKSGALEGGGGVWKTLTRAGGSP